MCVGKFDTISQTIRTHSPSVITITAQQRPQKQIGRPIARYIAHKEGTEALQRTPTEVVSPLPADRWRAGRSGGGRRLTEESTADFQMGTTDLATGRTHVWQHLATVPGKESTDR